MNFPWNWIKINLQTMKLRCFHGNKRVDPEPVRMSTWRRKKKGKWRMEWRDEEEWLAESPATSETANGTTILNPAPAPRNGHSANFACAGQITSHPTTRHANVRMWRPDPSGRNEMFYPQKWQRSRDTSDFLRKTTGGDVIGSRIRRFFNLFAAKSENDEIFKWRPFVVE